MHMLVVEDNPDYTLIITETLRFAGHDVTSARTIEEACRSMVKQVPDLTVVDVMLPDGTGLELCRWLRELSPGMSLLLLSGLDRSADIVRGFAVGADDYITKPFHPTELTARVNALLRRARTAPSAGEVADHLTVGSLTLDRKARTVSFDGARLNCTQTEYLLLQELMSAPGEVLTHAHLNARIWNYPDLRDASLLKGHMSALRRKLRNTGCHADLIRSVHGVGYAIEVGDTPPYAISA